MGKLFSITGALLFFLGCGGSADSAKHFSIQLENKNIQQNQQVGVTLKNKKDIEISDLRYYMDGKELPVENGKLTLGLPTLGNKTLVAKFKIEEQTVAVEKKLRLLAAAAPEVYTYEIVNSYPHDTGAYTQGLEFYKGTLYESTGKRGASTVRKVNFETGEVLQQINMDDSVFGEGITIMNDKLYQLTWQSGMGYVYDVSNLEKIKNFSYGKSREGWGLCNDGEKIFKSDGTEKIWFLDPETLEEQGQIEIVTNKSIFNSANELEYVNGKIYANVYQKESMMIIDAASGAIEGVINFGGLKNKVNKGPEWDEGNSVLNGVAYHPERETFFVTGKNWDKLFEVKIRKKDQ
ncbi:glutaminyl-peptide cyclotransferase [Flagellimonas halotolerans]|uniref:Glutaminyl-peptide cyclotransferase n=1 Tax=Flagellimonas halotolerans TaxID=3112164 RepID=A0ABU6ITY7_9FLAO|nr:MULTISPECIES: glutaminyl-peptide cyclotransferase [unclassified Allomuricauda]MEC3966558.1 glutaminyl-peptide cyclotransferase [Muricauda sp. SYSU M86414]MEC4266469.1 glutaminyl-peptide cyclotransferase [Muricauda sp. SYSU M84420]